MVISFYDKWIQHIDRCIWTRSSLRWHWNRLQQRDSKDVLGLGISCLSKSENGALHKNCEGECNQMNSIQKYYFHHEIHHEKGTRVSTFESDLGDWMNVSSIGSSWHRSNQFDDHTMIATHGTKGYSMAALSIYGTAGTALVYTNISFMEPICLSLWYQFYHNAYDCSFSIYKITDGNQTLLFTVDGNFTFYNKWINISVDVYGQDPFKMALEADFKQRDSTDARWIIIDDTSIAYRPCQAGIPVIIISTMVVMIVAAVVIIVIVCNRKRRAKNQTMSDSSEYNCRRNYRFV
ncbi:unnamed protein product [Mytilus edulis]|uniref:MAM domain-containing protein n=1 Tax=Mytilus edulis TaxID=6550 RepID=A0A8S3TFG8_MYTED|nr:unnamed protein product [Mytilus edulis]